MLPMVCRKGGPFLIMLIMLLYSGTISFLQEKHFHRDYRVIVLSALINVCIRSEDTHRRISVRLGLSRNSGDSISSARHGQKYLLKEMSQRKWRPVQVSLNKLLVVNKM